MTCTLSHVDPPSPMQNWSNELTFEIQGNKGRAFWFSQDKWEPLVRVTEDEIVLYEFELPNGNWARMAINRRSQKIEASGLAADGPFKDWGTCTKMPYKAPPRPSF